MDHRDTTPSLLPPNVAGWFRSRGWAPHAHQLAMVQAAAEGVSALLIAPTGGGKTLAGFLPSLIELSERPREGLHTLYISPLKALAVDIQRNLEHPVAEMRLPIRTETRTGDTPEAKRRRQRAHPPQILMTTPESLALLLSYADAGSIFGTLRCVIVDELHALAGTKRGDLLALGLARLARLAPAARRVGLSATVAEPDQLVAWLSRTGTTDGGDVRLVQGRAGADPVIDILTTRERLPWAGHMALHALKEVYARIREHRTTLLFVNTRAQAELVFQALWRINDENLPIALHHGSLAVEQRRKVEAAMARGDLRAVVATSSLDLGIDWAAVDLVVQIGAPKGASRLVQRIGRANHRMDEPSRALLVPANRFEVLECRAALDAVRAHTLDGERPRPGGLDVLAQHILGMACAAPFLPDELYDEIVCAAPYAGLSRDEFDDVLDFVATGGYALGSYERFHRLKTREDGRMAAAGPMVARQYRLNVGTIVQEAMLRVRLNRGPVLGEVEEYFIQGLTPGDSFVFAGQLLKFLGVREMEAMVAKGGEGDPQVPAYAGGRLPLSTHLAERVRAILHDPDTWPGLPEDVQEWLRLQRWRSVLPPTDGLLVETFPRNGKRFLVVYAFEGRNAHQTLGMLLTRRMERMGAAPLGFVATDYVLAVWSLRTPSDLDALFDRDMLGDDLEAWMDESSMLRRTFRNVAIIAGVIDRRHPGQEKTGRQVTFSSDLIYDVLRKHDPGHILLRATRADAAGGLTDIRRLSDFLARIEGRILHKDLDRISPLAVPVILEIGREQVYGSATDELLEQATAELVAEAMPELVPRGDGQGRLL
ncbi:ligase-associated DNA damage response DEXH box helicase [Azospirillum sp. RWY-5-1]|uniref:Ligase-associated DNA damage response DEXH box helicase n=1 Tax=Azospirillum oleiclasticum TaxID=2735135 RepID=A0ABX2T8P6_9PROT|nr:ligase-associated DNA damage response DEXH box helicase [Azospirillum oleiclasticum]NYZ13509.1 ligase-associated DNA damage response DEXH box helicase [Azospirillum oleiclasticum]NYZ20670.1 ligase-associated DNA damage response DEXH box helicase [Azospirillum oleiclasticum]